MFIVLLNRPFTWTATVTFIISLLFVVFLPTDSDIKTHVHELQILYN